MSGTLREEDERVLRSVVLGELAPDAEAVRVRAAASPALAEALAEWERTRGGLERVRAEDERLIAAARGDVTAADRELVAAVLARRLGGGAASSPVTLLARWRLAGLSAAAAAVLAVLLWALVGRGGGPAPTTLLGDEACVRPRGPVAQYSPFVVDRELDPVGGELTIVVLDEHGDELLRGDDLDATTWELSPEQAAVLRDVPRITWRYELYDRILDAWEFGECDAWRSP